MINIKMWGLIIVLNLSGVIGLSNLATQPIVTVNGVQLTTENSKLGDSFDSTAIYEFIDGELVNIKCSVKKLLILIKLSSNVHRCINTIPKITKEDVLNLKLQAENDGNFIECRITNYADQNPFVIRINLKLVTTKPESHNIGISSFKPPERCEVGAESKTDGYMPCVSGSIIEGLVKGNILGMYHSLRTNFSILYESFDGDILNLTCDADDHEGLKWKYDDTMVEKMETSNEIAVTPIAGSFKIKPNVTRCASITCEATKKQYEILLVIKKRVPRNIKYHGAVMSSSPPPESTNNSDRNEGDEGGISRVVKISIIVCALVFIAVMIFIIIRICKRKPKSLSTESNINYLNLPEHNKSTAPVPSQWQEAQYAAPKDKVANNDYAVPFKPTVDEMYATPIPKNQRPINGASASVSNDSNAADAPKNPRKGIQVLPVNKDFTYTELLTKPAIGKKPDMKRAADNEAPYAEVTPSDSSYASNASPCAEVNFIENPYTESDNSYAEPNDIHNKKYVNIFKDSKYVNADVIEDYAEPAYCEINKHLK